VAVIVSPGLMITAVRGKEIVTRKSLRTLRC